MTEENIVNEIALMIATKNHVTARWPLSRFRYIFQQYEHEKKLLKDNLSNVQEGK